MPTLEATTTTTPGRRRPSRASRRLGYAVGLLVNAGLLVVVNVRPGWAAVPFLSDDTPLVLGLVNASLVVGVLANALYLASDPPSVKALGDIAQNIVGLVATVRIWQVFPFDFGNTTFSWDVLARWVLAIGMGGSIIGVLAALVSLLRTGGGPRSRAPRG